MGVEGEEHLAASCISAKREEQEKEGESGVFVLKFKNLKKIVLREKKLRFCRLSFLLFLLLFI